MTRPSMTQTSMTQTTQVTRAAAARLILVLGGLAAVTPLTIDMYLPAMPQIADRLDTGSSQVQLTLTAFFVGLAIGQLVAGPLSDAFGRRRPLLVGLVAYVVISAGCALAPSIWGLTGLRLLQALGVATVLVLSRAILRDLFSGDELARKFSLLMLVTGLAPILAPVIGAQLLLFTDWRGIFLTFSVFGLLLLVTVALALPETLPPDRRRPASVAATLRISGRLLTDRMFVGYTLAASLAFAAMFAYIAGSTFVLQDHFGLSPQEFSLVFGGNAVGIMVMAQVNGRFVGRVSSRRMLAVGLTITAVGDLLVLAAAIGGLGLAGVLPPLFIAVSAIGLVLPNGTALALADHPEVAGTASALYGVVQFLAGGLAAPLVGIGGEASTVSMAVVMAGCGVLSLVTFTALTGSRTRRSVSAPEPAPEPTPELPPF